MSRATRVHPARRKSRTASGCFVAPTASETHSRCSNASCKCNYPRRFDRSRLRMTPQQDRILDGERCAVRRDRENALTVRPRLAFVIAMSCTCVNGECERCVSFTTCHEKRSCYFKRRQINCHCFRVFLATFCFRV